MRLITAFALAAAVAACSPAKKEAPPPETPAATVVDDATRTGVLDALNVALANDLGQSVDFNVDQLKVDGDWAWVVARPQALGGGALDFSQTKYAERAAAGQFDNGVTYALLERQDGKWTVCDFVVGPVDVAYLDWPQTYGAPATLMGLPEPEPTAPAK